MGNTVINTPELLNLDSTTGATVLAKGTISERPATPTFSVDYLVVAGGGAGGSAGGGGGGGVLTGSAINFLVGVNYTVTVGQGGAGFPSNSINIASNDGESSSISSIASATGGGGGGAYSNGVTANTPGRNGGSGGGGGYKPSAGGLGVSGEGFDGGASIDNSGVPGGGGATTDYVSAGGGGAGGIGNANTTGAGAVSGDGGVGVLSSINGTAYYWGGGGGGGGQNYDGGNGGIGGGGGGASENGAAGGAGGAGLNSGSSGNGAGVGGSGGANTGGGGGGMGISVTQSGSGGSGVVIIRYPNTKTITVGAGLTATTATVGTDKVTTFTAGTGTISFSGTVVGGENDATDGALRFNTETNKTEYFDGANWYEIVDEYASGFVGPGTNYFDTKLYTGNGSTQSIGGYINGSASFNGSSSKIDLGNNSSNNTSTISVSLWFKTAGHSAAATLINNGGANSNETGYFLGLNSNGTIKFEAGTGTVNGSVNYADSQWHQIVLTLNSGAYNIYVDGNTTPVITGSGAFTTTATRPTWIGQFSYTPAALEFFNGSIDQVRIYNVALSSSDVAALNLETAATATTAAFPSGQTAVATYTMDTSANGLLTTTDLSTVDYPSGAGCLALYEMNGNSNDTSNTYNGTPTNITYEGGAFDQAAVFNGSSSFIQTSLSLNAASNSVSFWFNADSVGSQNPALYFNNRGGRIDITINGTGSNTATASGENILINSTTAITGWNFVSIVFTGWASSYSAGSYGSAITANVYLNGGSAVSLSPTPYGQSDGLRIGRSGGGYYYDGLIDQVRVFNTALTQSQVTTLARGIATSYSGAATNVNFNGHLDFAPDLVWIKVRSANGYNHNLFDTIRGATYRLMSNLTNVQDSNGQLTAFNNNGFTLGPGGDANPSQEMVSWNWKAGGAAVTNNDGTIPTQVSANKDSGFSIATYTGVGYPNASTAEVGHGLTQAPDLVFIKGIGGTGQSGGAGSWVVGTGVLASNNWAGSMYLNSAAAYYTAVNYFWNGAATDSVVKLKNDWFVNGTNNQYVMYSWHSVNGFSKIGSYTGNGSATGPTVVTGFRPAFIMVKNTTTGNNWHRWYIFDNKRDTTNPNTQNLAANVSNGEPVSGDANINFLSNGFQISTPNNSLAINQSGNTFIFMAIA